MTNEQLRDAIARLSDKIYDCMTTASSATSSALDIRVAALRIEGYARIMNEYAKNLTPEY